MHLTISCRNKDDTNRGMSNSEKLLRKEQHEHNLGVLEEDTSKISFPQMFYSNVT